MKLPYLSQLVIPKSFDECVTYEKQILWLKSQIDTIAGGGDPDIIATLSEGLKLVTKDVEQLKSDVSSIDINAINESIAQINQEIENIKSSIANKQDKLNFDVAPTENSQNPVYSGGVKSYVDNSVRDVEQQVNRKVDETTFNQAIQNITNNYDTSEEVDAKLSGYAEKTSLDSYAKKTDLDSYATTESLSSYATKEELSGYATVASLDDKQDKLVFDQTPTLGSNNPVTSNGVKAALNSIPSVTLDDTVTESGVNAVKSSGVYSFVETEIAGLATKEELAQYETTESVNTKLESYATKSELGAYATTDALNSKQDSLTFDQTPTLDSQNPVTSDGIKKAIDAMVVSPIEIDQVVSGDSSNAVSSSGVYNFVVDQVSGLATTEQLADKQNKLTFDDTPTLGSSNPVTSNGVKEALNSIPSVTLDDTVTENGVNAVKSSGIYQFVNSATADLASKEELSGYATTEQLNSKQDTLQFDNTPTLNSNNPVTSDGIKKAIDAIPSASLDDTVTAESSNGVKSSGIYNFVNSSTSDLATKSELANYATKDDITNLATKEELSGYATTEQLNGKQNTLTFDDTPTLNSNNPVTSDGIKKAIDSIPSVTLDDAVTEESANGVKSSGIYQYVNLATADLATKEELSGYATTEQLNSKQDTLQFDNTPTLNSNNPVTSDGIKKAIDAIPSASLDDTVTAESSNGVKSSGIYQFVNSELENKQDKLTFDAHPTLNSQNPVTSDGVFKDVVKSWFNVGTVDIYFVPQGSGAEPVTITANVFLQSGSFGSLPTSIFLIRFELPATNIASNASFEINNAAENNKNYLQTRLGNLNMYGNILAGVMFTGVGNYSLHVDNISGQALYLSPDNIATTSSGSNLASCVLYGICTVR